MDNEIANLSKSFKNSAIAPPTFQGRPLGYQNSAHQAGLSPREKLEQGAALAGAKMLKHSTPFNKGHTDSESDSIKSKNHSGSTNGSKGEVKNDEVMKQLMSKFSADQAQAIQAAIF